MASATGRKIDSSYFLLLFQVLGRAADTRRAPRLNQYSCALDFVIDAIIEKYTAPQVDSKAEKQPALAPDQCPLPVRGLQDWDRAFSSEVDVRFA
jgi:hypothetical protein